MRLPALSVVLLAFALEAQNPPTEPPKPPPPPTSAPTKPTPADLARLVTAAGDWFAEPDQNLEPPASGEGLVGVFHFKNPREERIEWRQLTGSCTCSRATVRVGGQLYELRSKEKKLFRIVPDAAPEPIESISIGAGEEGDVELHVALVQGKGLSAVSLDIHTTDTKTPMMRLNLKATAVATFLLEPAETALGIVAAGEEHGFTVKVIPRAADFAITGAKPFPTGVTATYRRIDDAKPPHWLVTGTFASSWPGNANADLEFETNSKQAPIVTIKVHATVRLPVEAKPPFFSLGRVPLDKGGSARIALSRSDGKQLEVLGLRVEGAKDAAQFVTAHAFKAGSDLIVELVVAAGAPKGLLRGDVVIELDHPTVKERRINFNGFIR